MRISDYVFWSLVSEIGWETKSTDHYLLMDTFQVLCQKYRTQPRDMYFVFYDYRRVLLNALRPVVGDLLGDDGMDDLASHIIGVGKHEFMRCLKDPGIARERAINRNFKESFAYIFSLSW